MAKVTVLCPVINGADAALQDQLGILFAEGSYSSGDQIAQFAAQHSGDIVELDRALDLIRLRIGHPELSDLVLVVANTTPEQRDILQLSVSVEGRKLVDLAIRTFRWTGTTTSQAGMFSVARPPRFEEVRTAQATEMH